MADLSRREALVIVAATTAACACCADAADGDSKPNDKPTPKSIEIGKLADYDKDGFYDKFADSKVLVAKLPDRLVVMSNVCTHKRCVVKPKVDDVKGLFCRCHKGQYDEQGIPRAGPPKMPLVRYALKVADDGTITADTTQSFEERKWDDKAAFIPIKAS